MPMVGTGQMSRLNVRCLHLSFVQFSTDKFTLDIPPFDDDLPRLYWQWHTYTISLTYITYIDKCSH